MEVNTLVDPKVLDSVPELHHVQQNVGARHRANRSLGSNGDSLESLFADKQGNEYDPYSLAWRYLGLFKDCADDEGDGDDDSDGYCPRKLLWAAYVDPSYAGNAIEEYKYHDLATRTWDDSACQASGSSHRCARMDCHQPQTHFKLVGIFKETDGMYDFTEQLFKHEGYCLWGKYGASYETMETWMEKWPTSCTKLDEQDYYGNNLYLAMEPLPEGNMTLSIYTDSKCTKIHQYVNYESYLIRHYVNLYQSVYGYDYGYNLGVEAAEAYNEAISVWNEKMSAFKICQPCRAYNLFAEDDNDGYGDNNNRRFLEGYDGYDGDGEEQERFNCYDYAGYTNVNQCYKFATHTSIEAANSADLKEASAQGSILWIRSSWWTIYGRGGYFSSHTYWNRYRAGNLGFIGFVLGLIGHVLRKKSLCNSSGGDTESGKHCTEELDTTDSKITCNVSDSIDSTNAARSVVGSNSTTKFYLRKYGFLERRQRQAMPCSLKDVFRIEIGDDADAGERCTKTRAAAD